MTAGASSPLRRMVAVTTGIAAVFAVAAAVVFIRGMRTHREAVPRAPATRPAAVVPEPGAPDPLLADLAAWDRATSAARRATAEDLDRRTAGVAFDRLETFGTGATAHEVAVFRHEATGLEMVLVPAGRFRMGSDERSPIERPSHDVTLTRPFLVARTEVSQRVWEQTMGTNPSQWKGADLPVESVSWDDAVAFCAATGLELPSEAQWERACRAGGRSRYSFGDDAAPLAEFAWYDENSGDRTRQVGAARPNPLGLHDVHGNVWEWCADGWGTYDGAAATDPLAPPSEIGRVARGGAWNCPARGVAVAHRTPNPASHRAPNLGLRPVLTLAPAVVESVRPGG